MSTPPPKSCPYPLILALFSLFFIPLHQVYGQTNPNNSSIVKKLSQAEALLVSFKNDSAKLIVEKLIHDLEEMEGLDTPLGIRVQLAHATALERDEKDSAAIEKLLHVRELSREKGLWTLFGRSCLVLANLYEKIDRSEAALEQLRLADQTIKVHDTDGLYPILAVRLSSWHRIFGQRDSAHFFAREALASAPKFGMVLEEAIGHMLMGMLMRDSSDYASVQHYFSGLRLYKKLEDYTGCSYMFSGIAHYYDRSGKPGLALAYTDSMISMAHKAVAQGNEKHYSLPRIYRFRGELFNELGQTDSAWYYLEKGYQMELELARQNTLDKVIEIDARYRDEKKIQQLEEQALKIKYNEIRRNGLIAFLAIILLFLFTLGYSYLRLKKANQNTQNQANTLQKLHEARSRFFANISHELRTPLTLILGPLSILQDKSDQWDQQFVSKHLGVIKRNAQGLMRLVEEILDISRLDEHKHSLQEDHIALLPFIESVFSNFSTQFSYQNLSYTIRHDFNKELWIAVDASKLEKVLNNFLSNALKHTPIGGNIGLSVVETEDSLEIKVSDTGRGIHPKDIPFIFDRFYQSHQNDSSMTGGTGIGLSLVKEISVLMGADVSVESRLGKGSTFTFVMPKHEISPVKRLENHSEHTPASEVQVRNPGSNFTILIVEDNYDMREFIQELMKQEFREVITARNGVEALEILSGDRHSIDLIISDMMMPEMDGLTLMNTIRSNAKWAAIPTIMLTAVTTEKDKLTALRTGVDDYLTKPFSVDQLLASVHTLLYNHYQRTKVVEKDDQEEDSFPIASAAEQEWMETLEQIIKDTLGSGGMTVESLAESVHVSTRQLSRKVKRCTGMTPRKFIREVQLQAARTELENGQATSLLEVAHTSGFEHQGTFSTLFKNRFGKSPGEYLKTHSRMP